jgi:hypothetical protein
MGAADDHVGYIKIVEVSEGEVGPHHGSGFLSECPFLDLNMSRGLQAATLFFVFPVPPDIQDQPRSGCECNAEAHTQESHAQ